MKELIQKTIETSIQVKKNFFQNHADMIISCARTLSQTLKNNHKILLFGNGGSAADSQHIAAEFINRFQMERRPLPAIALTTDTSVITSIGNDYSFDDIFVKQVQALGKKGDAAIGITTSGNSPNIIKAVTQAAGIGMKIIGFSGAKGQLKSLSDYPFCVNSETTARIQEIHMLLAHILCDLTERILFDEKTVCSFG